MILLSIRVDGQRREHRVEHGRATLGSGPTCDLRNQHAGWPALVGTLVQAGTEVELHVPGRVGKVTLRVGDEIRIGRADVALVGLLPLPAADAGASAVLAGTRRQTGGVPAPVVTPEGERALFGEYAEASPAPAHPPAPPAPSPTSSGAFELEAATAGVGAAARPSSPSASSGLPPSLPAPRPPPKPSAPTQQNAAAAAAAAARAARAEANTERALGWRRQRDFGQELYEQVRRAPWFLCSMGVHVLIFLAFLLWSALNPMPPTSAGERGRLANAFLPNEEQENRGPDPEPPSAELDVLPPLEPILDPDHETETEPNPLEDSVPQVGAILPDELPTPDLGSMPTLNSVGRRTAPRKPKPAPAPQVDLTQAIAKENVRDATRRAAQHVRHQIGLGQGGPGEILKRLVADDVLVVEGEWDHHELVLRALDVPHRMISPHDPKMASGQAFERPRFVFWNCGDRLSPRTIGRLSAHVRAFVERGGYLFTSDWALGNVLKAAFPTLVDTQGGAAPLPEMVIDIAPTRAGAAHPLLDGVFTPGIQGRWWLEQASHDIVVKQASEVTVLIESPPLKDQLQRSPVMAITFTRGRGRVLHLLGHYYQEQGNLAGAVAAQRIALNFVMLGLSASPAASSR